MRRLRVSVLSFVLLTVANTARAQAPAATITAGFTLMSDDFGQEIKEAMLNSDSPTPALSGNSTSKIHVYAEAHVRRGKTRSIGILFGGANGYTSLTGNPTSLERMDLLVSFEVTTFGVLYSQWLGRYVRVGGGPAIHGTQLKFSASPRSISPPDRKRSLGWVAEAAVNLPRGNGPSDAVEITIQRRQVSDVDLAPRRKVSPSHWVLGVSMGLRF